MHYFAFINKELHLPVKCRLPASFVTAQPLQQLLLLLTEASGTRTRSKKNKKKGSSLPTPVTVVLLLLGCGCSACSSVVVGREQGGHWESRLSRGGICDLQWCEPPDLGVFGLNPGSPSPLCFFGR